MPGIRADPASIAAVVLRQQALRGGRPEKQQEQLPGTVPTLTGTLARRAVEQASRRPDTLDMPRLSLGLADCRVLCALLMSAPTVTTLVLSDNCLSPDAGATVGTMLQTNECLTHVNLSGNAIADGVLHIAEGLKSNRTLRHLNLADNFVTDATAQSLLLALAKTGGANNVRGGKSRLEQLVLDGNFVRATTLGAIGAALAPAPPMVGETKKGPTTSSPLPPSPKPPTTKTRTRARAQQDNVGMDVGLIITAVPGTMNNASSSSTTDPATVRVMGKAHVHSCFALQTQRHPSETASTTTTTTTTTVTSPPIPSKRSAIASPYRRPARKKKKKKKSSSSKGRKLRSNGGSVSRSGEDKSKGGSGPGPGHSSKKMSKHTHSTRSGSRSPARVKRRASTGRSNSVSEAKQKPRSPLSRRTRRAKEKGGHTSTSIDGSNSAVVARSTSASPTASASGRGRRSLSDRDRDPIPPPVTWSNKEQSPLRRSFLKSAPSSASASASRPGPGPALVSSASASGSGSRSASAAPPICFVLAAAGPGSNTNKRTTQRKRARGLRASAPQMKTSSSSSGKKKQQPTAPLLATAAREQRREQLQAEREKELELSLRAELLARRRRMASGCTAAELRSGSLRPSTAAAYVYGSTRRSISGLSGVGGMSMCATPKQHMAEHRERRAMLKVQARAEIYALNRIMRAWEKRRMAEYVAEREKAVEAGAEEAEAEDAAEEVGIGAGLS